MRSRAQDNLMNFYRLLLHLYPSSFREEFGNEMTAIFALQLERSAGLAARCGLWFSAFAEILFNAAMVHWEITRRDLFHSTRSLLRSPGFTLTAILLITIGIGANVAVFTLANFVLVRPLPFPEPQQLMRVWEKHPGYSRMELSPANYRDLKASSHSFAHSGRLQRQLDEPGWSGGAAKNRRVFRHGKSVFCAWKDAVLMGRYFQ